MFADWGSTQPILMCTKSDPFWLATQHTRPNHFDTSKSEGGYIIDIDYSIFIQDDDALKNLGTSKASIDLNSPPVCEEEIEPKVVTPDKGQERNILINDTLTISNGRVKGKQQTRFNNMHWPFLDELKDELSRTGVSIVSS